METIQVSDVDQRLDPEVRSRLLAEARQHFFRFGFSHVTMDELAADTGVSKKTYYRYFPSKEALVRAVFAEFPGEMRDAIHAVRDRPGLSFSTKLDQVFTIVAERLRNITPVVMADLRRDMPAVWHEFAERRRQMIQEGLGERLREGMRKGYIRRDLESLDLVLAIYVNAIDGLMRPELLEQLDLTYSQAFSTLVKITLSGLLTDKGRAELDLSACTGGQSGLTETETIVPAARAKRRGAK